MRWTVAWVMLPGRGLRCRLAFGPIPRSWWQRLARMPSELTVEMDRKDARHLAGALKGHPDGVDPLDRAG